MKVMILGQKWLAGEVLALCLRRGDEVVAVVTPAESDRLARAALDAGIRVVVAPRVVTAAHVPPGVDLLVCAHAHAFVTAGARSMARLGALGYHPSLLPRHRGRDAVRWAVHMRDPVTGGTVYWLTDRADEGPVAAQEWCWVRQGDTPDELWRRELGPMGLRLFEKALGDLDNGRVVTDGQDEQVATWEPAWHSGRLSDGA